MMQKYGALVASLAATMTLSGLGPTELERKSAWEPLVSPPEGCERAGPSVVGMRNMFKRLGRTYFVGRGGAFFLDQWQRAAADGWASLDVRPILPGGAEDGGNVMSRSTRRWITPPLDDVFFHKAPTTVRVRELDGRAETIVTVCSFRENYVAGPGTVEGSFTFNATRAQKDDRREVWELSVDAGGRVLIVQIEGRSVGNTFQYVLEMP